MKQTLLFFLLLFYGVHSIIAQDNVQAFKNAQFGISLGLNKSNYSKKDGDWNENGFSALQSIEGSNELGFALGILCQTQINNFLAARMQGLLSFTSTGFDYYLINSNTPITRQRDAVQVALPLHLIIGNKNKMIAPSGIIGARYQVDIASGERASNTNPMYDLRHDDLLLDVGFGVAFHFRKFIFKPEVIYSRGLINQVADNLTNPLNKAIESAYANSLSFRIIFYQ